MEVSFFSPSFTFCFGAGFSTWISPLSAFMNSSAFWKRSSISGFNALLMMFFSCYLLVSEIPMFALKFKQWGWKGNEVRYLFIISCVPLLAFFGITGIAIIIGWYVVLSIFTQRTKAHQPL